MAAVIMLNGHVFHSFTKPEFKNDSSFVLTQFVGGMPPAIFLFLVGITLAFLMESREKQAMPPGQRVVTALRRAGYLMSLALLFRLQLFLFGYPQTRWADLFRVDILNAMALAVAVFSVLAVFRTAERVRICATLGLVIAFASPIVSSLNWAGVPVAVRAYLIPDPLAFGFFPWGSFVAFGMSLGGIIRLARRDQLGSVMQWGGLLGLLLVVGARYCSDLPYSLYTSSDFWLDGPWLILIKVGIILVMLTAAYVWTQYGGTSGWSWMRQFGTTSLLVYWFHTELVYGRWLYFWKESLVPWQAALASVGVILLMLGTSVARTNWKHWRLPRMTFEYPFFVPRRVSGD